MRPECQWGKPCATPIVDDRCHHAILRPTRRFVRHPSCENDDREYPNLLIIQPRRKAMAAATQANPIPDLMYDWLTVLQSKAEGLNAYEKYIQDAEREGATK